MPELNTINFVIQELEKNLFTFDSLLSNLDQEQIHFKPEESSWSLLEIVCHLFDEEREDFRYRIHHILNTPQLSMPPNNPPQWLIDRKYANQNFADRLAIFKEERKISLKYLKDLANVNWQQIYIHPSLGELSAQFFLHNWLAHDYHHIRQINKNNYYYLKSMSNEKLDYAGIW
ncbi:MAG: DinB family protein [Bacteroidota bacterium]|nr:DinB family protein [Bacteroidota bacterium]